MFSTRPVVYIVPLVLLILRLLLVRLLLVLLLLLILLIRPLVALALLMNLNHVWCAVGVVIK